VIAGSRSFAAIGQWAADAGPEVLAVLGATRGPAEEPTFRRAFALVSPDALDRVLGAWLLTRAVHTGGRLVIAVDGKTVRGAKNKEGKGPAPGRGAGARHWRGPRPGRRGAAEVRGRADTRRCTPDLVRTSSPDTPPARPVRGRPWKADGYPDRATGTDVVRYTSVDTATQRSTV
jgi:hypothetical protein